MSGTQDVQITLTLQEWQVCRAGLLELPGKIGLPVIMKLEPQLMQATKPKVNGEDQERRPVAAEPEEHPQ